MKFSIGIPAYKAIYIRDCIESVLNQSYKNFEIIIINDASPDDIEGIVNMYSDRRIKYFRNDINIGAKEVVINWNNCLQKANGDFFFRPEPDRYHFLN